MSLTTKSVYTVLFSLGMAIITMGCSPNDKQPVSTEDAAESNTEIPTVTMPDQDAGDSGSSTSNEGSSS